MHETLKENEPFNSVSELKIKGNNLINENNKVYDNYTTS